jgi:hypothetical protein
MTTRDNGLLLSWHRKQPLWFFSWCLFVLLMAGGASGQPEEFVPRTLDTGPPPYELASDSLQEEQTQNYLKEIITSLNAKAAMANQKHLWQDGKWSTVLRSHLIDLSMWWKFADVTAWVLQTVGDHASVRQAFFFGMPFLEWMCEPFVLPADTALSGPQVEQELDRIARFILLKQEEGMAVSLDQVGDASLSEEAAKQYLNFYLLLIRQLGARDESEEVNLSLKLSALVYGLDKLENVADLHSNLPEEAKRKADEVSEALVKLLRAAAEVKEKPVFIRIDMEEYAYKNATLAIFKDVVEKNPEISRNDDGTLRLGVVIQAYLRDACRDLDDLRQWGRKHQLRVPVRLVKGAYEKYEKELAAKKGAAKSPVWNSKESTDASYEQLSEFLILNKDHFQFAFATHNIRSIAHSMALAGSYGISKTEFEFQMLQGMGDEIKQVVTSMGYRMRVYVPAGAYNRAFKYAGRRFSELANKDNALSRTLRGDYTHIEGPPPRFNGPDDSADGVCVETLVANARARFSGEQ